MEAALWVPVFTTIFVGALDATFLMRAQTEMWSIASDTSRKVALREMTEAEAKAYAESMAGTGDTFTATVQSNGTTVTTLLERPFADVNGLGLLTSLEQNLSVTASYRIEPEL